MNTEKEKLGRLLNLFPKQAVATHFGHGAATKDDVVTAVARSQPSADIKAFAKQFFGLTKQHVYFFETGMKELPNPIFPDFEMLATPTPKKAQFYLAELIFTTFVRPQDEEIPLSFWWPIMVSIERKTVLLRTTLMEKKVSSYFDPNCVVFTLGQNFDDEALLKKFRDGVGNDCAALDLNKGVKTLWASDVIDAQSSRWKTPVATATISMDGELTMKQKAPDHYAGAMKAPLLKNVFKQVKDGTNGNNFPKSFTADASAGILTFHTFGKNETDISNVVGEILRLN